MDKAAVLNKLRDAIPDMECIPGCTACCGHVPWSVFEYGMLSDDNRRQHSEFTLKCPHVRKGRCSIYDDRTITCRIFGVTEGLPCPRGVVAKKVLTTEEITALMQEYNQTFFKGEEP